MGMGKVTIVTVSDSVHLVNQIQTFSTDDASLTTSSTPLPITPSQQLRLLSGYYHLTRTWERLRSTPPVFAHAPSCSATWHQPGCTQAWVEFWKEKTRGEGVMGLGIADVIGRLKMVMKEYDRGGPT